MRGINIKLVMTFFLSSLLAGCSFGYPTPTPMVYADSVFSGYAYFDVNLNGQLDSEDTPLDGATFSVAINGIKVFVETTDQNGYAFILIPSSVDYPVTLSMEPPKDSNMKLIGDAEIIHNQADPAPKFLFSK